MGDVGMGDERPRPVPDVRDQLREGERKGGAEPGGDDAVAGVP